jgi:hypothetical protein
MKEERSLARPRPATHVWRAAAATLRGFIEGTKPELAARAMYPDDPVVPMVLRGAVGPAITTDPSWAGPLAAISVSQAVEDIVAMSAIGKLIADGALFINMGRYASVSVPGRAINPADAGSFVGEGQPAKVKQYDLFAGTLRPRKVEVIVTITREMSETSNIEDVLRVLLTEAAGLVFDGAVFSTGAATAAQSAGILNGVTAVVGSTGGSAFDACGIDVGTLVADVASRGGGARAVFIAAPSQATTMRFFAGGQFGVTPSGDVVPVAGSAALADKTVICIEPGSFATSIGAPEFAVSTVATLHQEDTTPADIVAGGTPATPVKSMFQIDALALKMTLWGDWCMRAPHVSYMTDASW